MLGEGALLLINPINIQQKHHEHSLNDALLSQKPKLLFAHHAQSDSKNNTQVLLRG